MDRLSFTSVMDFRFTLLSLILFLLVLCAEPQLNGPTATPAVNAVSSAQNPFLTYQAPSGSNSAHRENVLPTGNVANGQQRTDRAVFAAPPRCTQNCQDNTINPFLQPGVRDSDIEHSYQAYYYKLVPNSQPVPWAISQPTQRPASQPVPWDITQPATRPVSQPVPWSIPQPIPSPAPQPVPWAIIPQPTQRSIYQPGPGPFPQSGPGPFPQTVPGLIPGPTSRYTPQPAGQPDLPTSNPSISTQPVKTALPLPSFNSIYSTTISKKKCREYNNELLRMANVKTQAETNSSVLKVANEVCIPVNLITKGKKALQGEFPHMVALGRLTGDQFSLSCGGSLISSSWVLSAAHCTHDESENPNMARLGIINLKNNQDGLMIGIKSFLRHPTYEPPKMYGDIALVELQSAVSFSSTIRPACLYQGYGSVPNQAWVTGWGVAEYDGINSDDLQKALLTTIDNVECSSRHISSSTIPRGITPSMICAGDPKDGWQRDTCSGDSGGPFQVVHEDYPCLFQIVGITSFGEGCAVPESPGIYIRVAYYLPWIEHHVWPQN